MGRYENRSRTLPYVDACAVILTVGSFALFLSSALSVDAWRLRSVPFDGPVFAVHDWIRRGSTTVDPRCESDSVTPSAKEFPDDQAQGTYDSHLPDLDPARLP